MRTFVFLLSLLATAAFGQGTITVTHGGTGATTPGGARTNLGAQATVSATAPVTLTTNTIAIPKSTTAVDGYLSSTDWTIFNAKVPAARNVNTTAPITGGGDLSADRTIAIPASTTSANGYLSSTDWTTFNAKQPTVSATAPVTFTSNTVALPVSTTSANGYLSSTDWTTFNAKVPTARTITTTAPLTGTGDLSANRTIAIPVSTTSADGYLSSTDWTTFNAKVPTARTITTTAPLTGTGDLSANRTIAMPVATTSADGYISSTNWTTFNAKQTAFSPTATSTYEEVSNASVNQTGLVVSSGGGSLTTASMTTYITQWGRHVHIAVRVQVTTVSGTVNGIQSTNTTVYPTRFRPTSTQHCNTSTNMDAGANAVIVDVNSTNIVVSKRLSTAMSSATNYANSDDTGFLSCDYDLF